MDLDRLAERIARHLQVLVEEIGPRPPGSPANRRATDHVSRVLAACGLDVQEQAFEATWWLPGPAGIDVGSDRIDLPPTPFGRPCDAVGPILRLASDTDLAAATAAPGPGE